MEIQIIEIIFFTVFAIAVIVWGISLRMAAQIGKNSQADLSLSETEWQQPTHDTFDEDQERWEVQGVEVTECDSPADAIQKLAKKVADGMGNANAANQFRIEKAAGNRLIVSGTGTAVLNRGMGMPFDDAEFDAVSLGNGNIEIRYRLSFVRLQQRVRKICMWIILGLGLPVLLIGFTVLWMFVVQHPNPAVRWQVFQALQVSHVLWPPFLFLYQYKAAIRHAKNSVPNMLRSLSFQ